MKTRKISLDLLTIFLILISPFLEFAYTNRFIFEIVNVVILAGHAVVALAIALLIAIYPNRSFRSLLFTLLILVFLDSRVGLFSGTGLATLIIAPVLFGVLRLIHSKANTVLIAMFGGIIVGIFFLPFFPNVQEFAETQPPDSAKTANLPIYVHIVLDEHTGIEGFDDEIDKQKAVKQSAKDLYINNGFRLFGRAYSQYRDTYSSLSAALNSYQGVNPEEFYVFRNSRKSYILTDNKYFRDLHAAGFTIQIYQTVFVNFCEQTQDIIQRCLTYDVFGTSSEALAELDATEKLAIILSRLRFFYAKGIFRDAYKYVAAYSVRNGLSVPVLNFEPPEVGPIPVIPVFDKLIADIANAPAGSAFFAHLLVPHHRYSVDGRCEIRRPVVHWNSPQFADTAPGGRVNTARSRATRYDEYVDQVECALAKVDELIEAMRSAGKFENAIVIVHGDHGSRITQTKARKSNAETMLRQDYIDAFSTLFAVKAPHITPGYDLRMLPLEQLLRFAEGDALANTELSREGHVVYLRDDPPIQGHIEVPMPELPGGSNALRDGND